MYTKSLIQQYREIHNIKESVTEKLTSLMEAYNVKDNIFRVDNLTPVEVEKGYFIPSQTFSSIDEAVKNMDIVRDCVRIQENKTFTVGRTYKTLSECSEYPQIFDIQSSQSVR
jgi:hypothetical protein